MKLKLLFWNVRRGKGTQLGQSLTRLADSGVDVFLFAEAPDDSTAILNALNASVPNLFRMVDCDSRRVRFFWRQQGDLVGAKWTDRYFDGVSDRITAIELQPDGALSVLIVGAHLVSPATGISTEGLADWSRSVANDIRTIEGDVGHDRTIFVGDLNMNPFDNGLVSATALHAVMSRELTRNVVNHNARKGKSVFYNPMWSCLGDRPTSALTVGAFSRPPGTHYYSNTGDRSNTFWQMYDQVLLRPTIMDQLANLEILRTDGVQSFVTSGGQPRRAAVSDHLPILFELIL